VGHLSQHVSDLVAQQGAAVDKGIRQSLRWGSRWEEVSVTRTCSCYIEAAAAAGRPGAYHSSLGCAEFAKGKHGAVPLEHRERRVHEPLLEILNRSLGRGRSGIDRHVRRLERSPERPGHQFGAPDQQSIPGEKTHLLPLCLSLYLMVSMARLQVSATSGTESRLYCSRSGSDSSRPMAPSASPA
jgi:hypothetical protein